MPGKTKIDLSRTGMIPVMKEPKLRREAPQPSKEAPEMPPEDGSTTGVLPLLKLEDRDDTAIGDKDTGK